MSTVPAVHIMVTTEEDAEASHQIITTEGYDNEDMPSFRHNGGYSYVYLHPDTQEVYLLNIQLDPPADSE